MLGVHAHNWKSRETNKLDRTVFFNCCPGVQHKSVTSAYDMGFNRKKKKKKGTVGDKGNRLMNNSFFFVLKRS